MISLFDLCLASLTNWLFEYHLVDLDNVAGRLQALLMKLPNRLSLNLISTLLHRLQEIMSSHQYGASYRSEVKQRELIPLLKVIVKTSKILCWDGGNMKGTMNTCSNNYMCII